MSIIKIHDIAFVRFSAPDLDAMKTFLIEFGLTPLDYEGALFARGAGPQPFVHWTVQGEPDFKALGFRAQSLDDLQTLATSEGAPVELLDAPGGSYVVRLTDPNGHGVEVVAGQTPAEPLPLRQDQPHNDARTKVRLRRTLPLRDSWSERLS